jgi:hypothetical protein
MHGYITDELHKYNHAMTKQPQYTHYIWTKPAYGQHMHYAPLTDETPPSSKSEITRAQQIVGTLLYYECDVDPTLIISLSTLVPRIVINTATMMSGVSHLLDYCSTHPEANIRYYSSDMQPKIHSDAYYLSEPKVKSRIGGYFDLENKKNIPSSPLANAPLLCHFTILKHVVSSIAEAKFGAMFVNAKTDTVTCTILTEMGHP